MSEERRLSPRVPCDLPVDWRRGLRTLRCRARDLNVNGLFVATEVPVPVGYAMDLCVHFPTGPLEILGVARYVGRTRHGHGIGVQVHVIDKKDSERWLVYYRSLRRDLLEAIPEEIARHFGPR
jgi:hypothetical protein